MKILKRFFLLFLTTLTIFFISESAFAQKIFVFDPQQTKWFAYDNGELVGSGAASGGASYCRDIGRKCHTPSGTFHVQSKGSASCKSSLFPVGKGGAPMPYCMFFSKNYAIHGSYEVPTGRNASHGCIRVHPSAALWLSRNFIDVGTTVVVKPY